MPLVTRTSVQGNMFRQATEPTNWQNGDIWVDTDNANVSVNNSGTAVQIGIGTLGTVAQAVSVNAGATALEYAAGGNTFARVVKKINETISNNNTIQNDNELFVDDLVEDKDYSFMLKAYIASATTPDFQYSFELTNISGSRINGSPSSTVPTDTVAVGNNTGVVSSNSTQVIVIFGTIAVSGGVGKLQFRWAQLTSDAANTSVLAGSSLVVWEETP